MGELYTKYTQDFPVVSIEDPFDQNDFESYGKLNAKVGAKTQIVGYDLSHKYALLLTFPHSDDLLVTNPKRIQKAIDEKSCNALLLKLNRIIFL